MTDHERKVRAAREAIDAVFADFTVPQRTTMESLEELQGAAAELAALVRADLFKADAAESSRQPSTESWEA